jgi:hypothetical protein
MGVMGDILASSPGGRTITDRFGLLPLAPRPRALVVKKGFPSRYQWAEGPEGGNDEGGLRAEAAPPALEKRDDDC